MIIHTHSASYPPSQVIKKKKKQVSMTHRETSKSPWHVKSLYIHPVFCHRGYFWELTAWLLKPRKKRNSICIYFHYIWFSEAQKAYTCRDLTNVTFMATLRSPFPCNSFLTWSLSVSVVLGSDWLIPWSHGCSRPSPPGWGSWRWGWGLSDAPACHT